MFRKVCSLLLVLVLVVGCMSCVSATHYYGDFNVEVGDVFNHQDCCRMAPNHFDDWDVLFAIRESGLCKELEFGPDGYGCYYWKHSADRVGSYTYTHWYGDDDYLTVNVKPHLMTLISCYEPFINSDGLLNSMVIPSAVNPIKDHPDNYEFVNSTYIITCISNTTGVCYQTLFNTGNNPSSDGSFMLSDIGWKLKNNNNYYLSVILMQNGNWSSASKEWNFNT
jgi:hypothetical protein